ncbi:cell wall hydrolase [Paenibacillus spiritus]|uniref:Cell wall hydrolase n=1 Tax=Paenibacillus spiritus TaxID=2496557 RepID=A0A5J5G9D8_9BACL|nr:cell wall hydrolase [Paenibacillus spiritus]KAA9004799.1 cell wall hydrolase [Paenibacillus spiritus]
MLIFRQNRWVALLVGVILVCFSSIILFQPRVRGGEYGDRVTMNRLQGGRAEAKPVSAAPAAMKESPGGIRASQPGRDRQLSELSLLPAQTSGTRIWETRPAAEVLDQWKSDRDKKEQAAQAAIAQAQRQAKVKAQAAARQAAQKSKTAVQANTPTILYFTRTELLTPDQKDRATESYSVSREDLLLLQRIVMAEAEGEPYIGKVAVANVVLNRLRSANFPDTIRDVIYQKSQFSPVQNGRLQRVKPNADSIRAVNEALSGVKAVTDDTYYFLSLRLAQDLTVHHTRKFAVTIGNHSFYR